MAVVAEQAPESAGSANSFFTKRLGPLPVWAWAAIGAGGAYLWWRHKQNTAGATSTAASTAADTNSFDYGPSIAAQQSEIQALQGEESTEDTDARNPAPQSSGVSRANRSPKVRRQIHTIHEEHAASERRKQGTRPTSSAVKTSKPAPARTPARQPARTPARRTTNRRAG